MEEKPTGALGVIVVLALTILVFWLGVYALFLARG
ncbi:cytochrome c oxidase subunit 2A [Thermus composti]|uniref:Cytochrome c oxidase subunit 2A n=1 Tax=Thermus composti TaxID=532059 RepID=A0ABV6Q2S2_9DEIN|nr:cytochrome c oxidase subunit 2A [Thermus composti]